MNKTGMNSMQNNELLLGPFLAAAMIILIILRPYMPDKRPDRIRHELTKHGCCVEAVDFEYVAAAEGHGEWIYRSSEPVVYDGVPVSQWLVYSYSVSPPIVRYVVKPYLPAYEG